MEAADSAASIPSGVVAFLFTDVEGSTQRWAADPAAMELSLRVHDSILRSAIERHGGYVFTTAGDAFCAAFQRASDAVASAEAAQSALETAAWPGPVLQVRMGIHLGEAIERAGDYFGPTVNTAARVEAAGHGGQLLVTDAVRSAAGLEAIDLGPHELRDVPEPVHLWQVGAGDFPPLRTVAHRSNLPAPATRLIGRADDVRAIRLMLAEHRLVTLVAVGGVGKTRLAIEAAEAEAPHWRDGVWFVDLTPVNSDDGVARAVATALRLELRSDDIITEVADYVAGRELMIVLDNCEHVIDTCADLATAVLEAGGRSVMLATSREWLDIDGERVFQVASLDSDGRQSPAVRLFVDRACAVLPDFLEGQHDWNAISELCRRLDGIPLAIELAASRVAVMSPEALIEGLDDRFRLLSGGRRRQRQRTLEATIDWSYDLLEPDEQQTFRTLGVFSGSFDIEAVADVCEISRSDAIDLIEVLFARSLVAQAAEAPHRFRLLETLKAYAEDRLFDAGEADAVRNRHAAHFTRRSSTTDPPEAQDIGRQVQLLPDMANLLQTADLLETQGRWDELVDHISGITSVSSEFVASMLTRIRRCEAHVSGQDQLDQLARAELYCAMVLADWGAYMAICAKLRASPDRSTSAFGYLYLALVSGRHSPADACALIDRFVEQASDSSDVDVVAEANVWRAMVAAMDGDLQTAQRLARGVVGSDIRHTTFGLVAQAIVGVARWAEGDAAGSKSVVNQIENDIGSPDNLDPQTANTLRFSHALPALASDDLDSARAAVKVVAVDAASGRHALVEGDAVALLAELARLEGDTELARELIMHTGTGRSPASIAVTRHIATTLGVDDELHAMYCSNMMNAEWALDRPKRTLDRELQRRGWAETI